MDNDFVNKHINLVRKIAHSFNNSGLDFEDLVQEGLIGLFEAHKKFDEKRGVSFVTFATHCIKNNILGYVLQENKHYTCVSPIADNTPIATVTDNYINHNVLLLPEEMPEIEKKILFLYFVEKKTLIEISEILNISREKTRQIKNKAMRRYKADLLPQKN